MPPENASRSASSSKNSKYKFLISALNGSALYILAYYLVWGLHDAAKVTTSLYYKLQGNWDPSRVQFTVADDQWWRSAVVAVYGSGPLVCAVLGGVAFRWYWQRERAQRGHLKLLLLWVVLHSCNAVFGALLADTFTESGFWYVPSWLFQLGNVVNVLLAILAGLAQLALGYFGAVAFLQAHDSKTVMRYTNRQWMVASTLITPWLAGSLFIALAKLPYLRVQETLHLAMMGLLVMPLALGCLSEVFSSTVRKPKPTRVAWALVAWALVVAVSWRLVFSPPVAFGEDAAQANATKPSGGGWVTSKHFPAQ